MTLDLAVYVVFFLGSLAMAVASLKLVLLLNRNPRPAGATRAEYRREIRALPEYPTLVQLMRCAMAMLAVAMVTDAVTTPGTPPLVWFAVGMVCVGAVGTLILE